MKKKTCLYLLAALAFAAMSVIDYLHQDYVLCALWAVCVGWNLACAAWVPLADEAIESLRESVSMVESMLPGKDDR